MADDGLAERLSAPAGVALSARQRSQLSALLMLLEDDPHAPTAVRSPAEALDVHLADSLAALELEVVREAASIVDIGSGAGFPGIVLAVALPDARVVLLESQRRRCEFMRRTCSELGLESARVVCARAEEWGEGLEAHDLVVARAVAAQPVVLEYAAPLLSEGGTLVDWRGRRDSDEEARAARAAAELGLASVQVLAVTPYAASERRHLHVYSKVGQTPDRFPRRPGVARRRPLGTNHQA